MPHCPTPTRDVSRDARTTCNSPVSVIRGRPRPEDHRRVRLSYSTESCNDASDRQGALMKWLMWVLIAVVIAIGLVLLAGQSDLRRFQRMRRM